MMLYRQSKDDKALAIAQYQDVIARTKKIAWLRFEIKASERLAHIYIVLGQFEDARKLIEEYYPKSE
jgi:hypothetical protein